MNTSLSATYTATPTIQADAEYWIRLEQVQQNTDAVSMPEAAAVVDAAFNLSPCEQAEDLTGGDEQPIDEQGVPVMPTTPEILDLAAAVYLHFMRCAFRPDGGYEAQLLVYRSHVDEPYKLTITNGALAGTVVQTGDITQGLEVDGISAQLECPAAGPVTCSVPYDRLEGSTLIFFEELHEVVTVSYPTRYDLVTIDVDGDPDTLAAKECIVRAWYHAMVAGPVNIEAPQPDESDDAVSLTCDEEWNIDKIGDEVTCYEEVRQVTKCQCSGTEDEVVVVERDVPCPREIMFCPDPLEQCRHFMGTHTEIVGYTDCGETTGDISDPEFYKETCCEYPLFPLPKCSVITSKYRGGKGIEGGPAKYKALYGNNVRLVGVGPANGQCGTITVTQQMNARNCCEEVTPLVYDTGSSVSVLAPDTSGIVVVTGGKSPYTWSVRGKGCWLNAAHTLRDGETILPTVLIYTDEYFCGPCAISVTDGCSIVIGGVQSSLGQWVITSERPRGLPGIIYYPVDGYLYDTGAMGFGNRPNTILPCSSACGPVNVWYNGVNPGTQWAYYSCYSSAFYTHGGPQNISVNEPFTGSSIPIFDYVCTHTNPYWYGDTPFYLHDCYYIKTRKWIC